MEADILGIANSLSTKEAQPKRLEILQQLAQRHPENPYVFFHVAVAYDQSGNIEQALAAVRQALRHLPHWTRVVRFESELLRRMNRVEEAIATLRMALRQPTNHPLQLRQDLANLLGATGQYQEARREYEELLRVDPHNPHWQMRLGSLALVHNDWEVAHAQFSALSMNRRPQVEELTHYATHLDEHRSDALVSVISAEDFPKPASLNYSVGMYFLGLLAEQTGAVDEALDHYYRVEEHDFYGVDRYYQKARFAHCRLAVVAGRNPACAFASAGVARRQPGS